MADLLALSSRIIDSGVAEEPVNRITQELSEIADGIAVVESFSHSVALAVDDGLVVFDASGRRTARAVVQALRRWSQAPVRTLVYTHGHLDHVGGSPAFLAEAADRGDPRPTVVAHEGVLARFARYRRTDRWNRAINARQFGWVGNADLSIGTGPAASPGTNDHSTNDRFLPDDVAEPEVTFAEELQLSVGGTEVCLRHGRGETDDHAWAWIPSHRAICAGDFFIWNFPNAGNPQKVQRYPDEWAATLRAMAALDPELLVPAHGLPVGGADRVRTVLLDVAEVLDDLVDQVVSLMNEDATLDDIVHTVRVAPEVLARPYLRPLYDEPEFVVRNIWRLYGGWWDGNPARLKPPPDAELAREVAHLAGGAGRLAARAQELASQGALALASQLAEWAAQAGPQDEGARQVRADVYHRRHRHESSLMAKGIFAAAAAAQPARRPAASLSSPTERERPSPQESPQAPGGGA